MILTLPDHDERRRIINKMHRTKDKDLCRRLNAILLLADGHSVSAVSRLTAAARSSINRWVNWYTLFGLEGLKASLGAQAGAAICSHLGSITAVDPVVSTGARISALALEYRTDGA